MTYQEIVAKVAKDLHLPDILVDRTYKAYWKVIRAYIISLPLKAELTDEEFKKLRPNINIPSIGKLYVTLERYHNVKTMFNIKKERENAAH